jgi:flagellar hook-associated protein 3 FlgL
MTDMGSFYPMVAGRSSTSQIRYRMLYQLANDNASIQNIQKQLSTGRRITRASEDVPAALRAMTIQANNERKTQFRENLETTQSFLGVSDTTLANIHDLLTEARATAVQSVDSTLSDAQREAISLELSNSIDRLVQLSNSKFRDRYLLSGGAVKTPPFETSPDGGIIYKGDFNSLSTMVDFHTSIEINASAQDALGIVSEGIIGSTDLNPGISPTTPLADLNLGQGVGKGLISFSNGTDLVELDFTGAYDLNDIVQTINGIQLGNRTLSASLSPTGLLVNYADNFGGNLRILDVGTGTTAKQLGLRTQPLGASTPINGTDLNPILRELTRLDSLNNGSGINLASGLRIQQGSKTYTIATSGLTTIEDLFNAVKASGAKVVTEIADNGRTIRIQSIESGTDLTIGENGGSVATALGIRTFSGTTALAKLNYGQGVTFGPNADLVFTRSDGTTLELDLNGVTTVTDVINRINNDPLNQTAATRITASLATTGNGIVLTALPGTQPVKISTGGASQAAWDLGLVPRGQDSATFTNSGANVLLQGKDVSGQEVKGALNTILKLKAAVEKFDLAEIERLTNVVNADVERMGLARGELGMRQQRIEKLIIQTDDQQIALTAAESKELDVDLAQAISDLQARQAAMQASLNLIGTTAQLSIWNYL